MVSPMRIAVDTRSLRPPLTGIGRFAYQLIDAILPLLSPHEELHSFNGWGIEPLDADFLARVERLNPQATAVRPLHRAANKAYVFLQQKYMARKCMRALHTANFHRAEKNFDVFHALRFAPPGAFHKPVLPFIHDLSHVRFPHLHPRERVEWLDAQLKLLVDVPYVQTNSEFTKSEIIAVLGIPPHRIHVTYAAPGVHFRPNPEGDDSRLATFNVKPNGYFLAVGTREPRKNFRTVAEAYTMLPAALRARIPLLWVGPSGWGDLSLSPAVERAREMGQIGIIGYLPDRDLAALYRHTILFVMPSIYEGFGLPVVEAMACGARVALSKIPVFEEIAGTSARYVDPMDVEGWRLAMKDAIDAGHQSPNCHGPRPDLSRFSWHSSAATTLGLYRRLAFNN